MRQLYSINGNSQKLDGGAMFGNAPKAVWKNWVEVDEQNRIDLACRALLIKDEDPVTGKKRNVLLEVGVGAFFEPKMKQRFGIVESQHVLLESLAKLGLTHKDIDIIVLSHLHFDHAGGLLNEWQENKSLELLFPNATFIFGKEAWLRATKPHSRDRASFLPELMSLLKERDKIEIVEAEQSKLLGPDYRFHYSHGHTPGMMLTEVSMPSGPVVFCADLIPGEAWVHLPITMGYDRFAEQVIDEKEIFLADMLARKGRLFFTHDHKIAMGLLTKSEQNKYCLAEKQADLVAFSD